MACGHPDPPPIPGPAFRRGCFREESRAGPRRRHSGGASDGEGTPVSHRLERVLKTRERGHSEPREDSTTWTSCLREETASSSRRRSTRTTGRPR